MIAPNQNLDYGDFVVVGYYTGGRAFAQYMGNADSNTNVEQKTKYTATSFPEQSLHTFHHYQ